MNASRTVFVSVAVAMTVFLVAGGRFERVVRKLGGPNTAEANAEKGQAAETIGRTLIGWAFLFVSLSVMADFQPTAPIAQGFALLIMLTVLLAYGVDAFGAITAYVGNVGESPASTPGTGGGARLT